MLIGFRVWVFRVLVEVTISGSEACKEDWILVGYNFTFLL